MNFTEQIEKIDSISLQTLFRNMLFIIQSHEERIKMLEDKYQKHNQSIKKYQKSEKGKAAQKRANAKYYQKKKMQKQINE